MKILVLANYDLGLYQFRKELLEALLKENLVTISLPDAQREEMGKAGRRHMEAVFDKNKVVEKTVQNLY